MAKNESNMIRVWRVFFIFALCIVGGLIGITFGRQMIESIRHGDSQGAFALTYRGPLSSDSGYFIGLCIATVLGVFISYLIATAAANQVVQVGVRLENMQANEKIAVVIGVILGLIGTAIVSPILLPIPSVGWMLLILVGIAFLYLSVIFTTSLKDEIRIVAPGVAAGKDEPATPLERCKILDTNVIIDGRVADICRTGFLEGPIYVPGFVLDELQHIADSADSLKRARGRRGLDILNQMRTELKMLVRTYDSLDPNDRDEVDSKLVKLAKELDGLIVTNDFNLNKVAELQGVKVLNINELAHALKPVVLPGEEMRVTIIKEGKELNQGVAYLDDGTMIVVEGARRRIGETLDVVTNSVLQTIAGKMIFASIRNPQQDGDDDDDNYEPRGVRPGPRGGPRNKVPYRRE